MNKRVELLLPAGNIEKLDYAMSNSLGFGGHNATILMKRYEEGNRE